MEVFSLKSKGGILEKTVQYLIDIKLANEHLSEHIKNLDKIKIENELLKQEVSFFCFFFVKKKKKKKIVRGDPYTIFFFL